VGSTVMGATPRQLMLLDASAGGGGASGSRPLLVDMADPELAGTAGAAGDAGLPFMRALGCFKRRCAYANAINDALAGSYIRPRILHSSTSSAQRQLFHLWDTLVGISLSVPRTA